MTSEELAQAVRDAMQRVASGDEGITTQEIADALGVTSETARRYLLPIVKSGMLVSVRVRRLDIHNQSKLLPGWRFKE